MEAIKPGKFVQLAYEVFELESDGTQASMMKFTEETPDAFVYGVEPNLLEGFAKGLQGLEMGADFDMTFGPDQAFGEHNDEYIMHLDKAVFTNEQGEFDSKQVFKGNILPMMTEDGYRVHGIVLDVTDDKVSMDFNHPLAGKTIRYVGKVVLVRDATPEEVQPQHSCSCGCDHCGEGDCGDHCEDDHCGCGGCH